jgi:hypothetical protein
MYYGWETPKLTYEQSIKLVTIQGLKILKNEAYQDLLVTERAVWRVV